MRGCFLVYLTTFNQADDIASNRKTGANDKVGSICKEAVSAHADALPVGTEESYEHPSCRESNQGFSHRK